MEKMFRRFKRYDIEGTGCWFEIGTDDVRLSDGESSIVLYDSELKRVYEMLFTIWFTGSSKGKE